MPRNDVALRAFIERRVKAFGSRNFSRKKAQMTQKIPRTRHRGIDLLNSGFSDFEFFPEFVFFNFWLL